MRVKSYSNQRPQVPWKQVVPVQESILLHLCTPLPSGGCKTVLKGDGGFNLATRDQCHILQIVLIIWLLVGIREMKLDLCSDG